MAICMKCERRIFHFFHEQGDVVTGIFAADVGCHKCYVSEPHFYHDTRAFNARRSLRS